MTMLTAGRRVIAIACSLAVLALVATGCGSSSNSGSSSSTTATGSSGSSGTSTQGGGSAVASASLNQQAAKQVPSAVKSKGTMTVAMDASYAPNEFFASDGKTIQGMDVDMAHALASSLGLSAKPVNATFDSIIPGLAAGKYDLGMSSFTDTKEREKTVDFVDYFSAGTSFFVKAQGGPNVAGLSSLCGHKVAVEKGTTQQSDAQAQAKKCSVSVLVFPDQNGVNLAVSSGRADVGMADSPVAAYAVKQSNGQFKLAGQTYGTAPYGIAIPKSSGMTKAVQAGMQGLMDDGTYGKILSKWGIQSGAIHTATINGATS